MAPQPASDCTVQELSERRSKGETPVVLDVRNPNELEMASLEGTIDIPMSEVPQRLSELDEYKAEELIVMCHHGGRSARVQGFLVQQGFSNVRNLVGGIHAWSTQIDDSVPTYE